MSKLVALIKELESAGYLADKIVDSNWELASHYVFTGIGLRENLLHLGHHALFELLARISRAGVPLLFQVSNDEKRYTTRTCPSDQDLRRATTAFYQQLSIYEWGPDCLLVDNMQDRDILRSSEELINSHLTLGLLTPLFGRGYDIYRAAYTGRQLAPMMLYNQYRPGALPVVVTYRDQLPFFLAMRDLSQRLKMPRPQIIVINPLLSTMMSEKMSSSDPRRAVFLQDLQNIRGAISGDAPERDFCLHVLRYLDFATGRSSGLELEAGNNKKLKVALIQYLQRRVACKAYTDRPFKKLAQFI